MAFWTFLHVTAPVLHFLFSTAVRDGYSLYLVHDMTTSTFLTRNCNARQYQAGLAQQGKDAQLLRRALEAITPSRGAVAKAFFNRTAGSTEPAGFSV